MEGLSRARSSIVVNSKRQATIPLPVVHILQLALVITDSARPEKRLARKVVVNRTAQALPSWPAGHKSLASVLHL